MQGDRYLLVLKDEVRLLHEIRKAAALTVVAHARGSKEELNSMVAALDKAHRKYDELKEKMDANLSKS